MRSAIAGQVQRNLRFNLLNTRQTASLFSPMEYRMSSPEEAGLGSAFRSLSSPLPSSESRNLGERRPSILLIDDDFALRRSLAEFLNDEGFDVECAADGLEGLRRLALENQRRPSVILLDMMMPRMNGLEFCARQKQEPADCQVPIIAITGVGPSRPDLEAMGLYRAFSKPMNLADLLRAIRELTVAPPH